MNSAELKIKIFRQLDSFDYAKLNEFYGLLQNYISSKNDVDEWIGVSAEEKQGIEAAIGEMDEGKGIQHSKVMSKFRKKYSHD